MRRLLAPLTLPIRMNGAIQIGSKRAFPIKLTKRPHFIQSLNRPGRPLRDSQFCSARLLLKKGMPVWRSGS